MSETREMDDPFVVKLRQLYTRHVPIVCADEPDAQIVWLKVGVQSFRIGDAENEEHAEWFRTQVARALARVVDENQPPSTHQEEGL